MNLYGGKRWRYGRTGTHTAWCSCRSAIAWNPDGDAAFGSFAAYGSFTGTGSSGACTSGNRIHQQVCALQRSRYGYQRVRSSSPLFLNFLFFGIRYTEGNFWSSSTYALGCRNPSVYRHFLKSHLYGDRKSGSQVRGQERC